MKTAWKLRKFALKRLGNVTFRVMFRIAAILTPKSIERLSRLLGWMGYKVSRRYRRMATANLTAVYGNEYPPEKIDSMVREVFRNFSRGALEFFYLSAGGRDIDSMIDMTGIEYLEEALKNGKGVVVITAHFGNWELMARKFCSLGYKLTVIARNSDDPGMTGIATKIREGAGYKVLGRDKSVRRAIECLRNNEVLGILPDQNTAVGGIMVDFFGRPAATATGPAVLALRTGAAVIPAFAPRGEDGKYHMIINKPIEYTATGDRKQDEYKLTAAITKAIEEAIREYPTQWLWLHDRWKRSASVENGSNV